MSSDYRQLDGTTYVVLLHDGLTPLGAVNLPPGSAADRRDEALALAREIWPGRGRLVVRWVPVYQAVPAEGGG